MSVSLSRAQISTRYRITGRLVFDTALHIGGREAITVTESPVIRDGSGYPFIPGSSLKGAFRAAVERLVPNIPGLRSCGLSDKGNSCAAILRKKIKDIQEKNKDKQLDEDEILCLLDDILCATCRTFGTTHLISVAFFHDASLSEVWRTLPEVPTQIRDGVGIDRDSERAHEGAKFDYEVVPPQAEFEFTLTLENPSERDLGLIALGLQEFKNGMVPLGGIRSRGLGRCHLEEIEIQHVDLSNIEALKAYLLESRWDKESADDFIKFHLTALMKEA